MTKHRPNMTKAELLTTIRRARNLVIANDFEGAKRTLETAERGVDERLEIERHDQFVAARPHCGKCGHLLRGDGSCWFCGTKVSRAMYAEVAGG